MNSSGGDGSLAGNVGQGGGGRSFAAGFTGGSGGSLVPGTGGFNDGGYGGGGGGGGYSGGGSFDSGTNQFLVIDTYADGGSVVITPLAAPVPEPALLALFGVGLAGLLAARRREC